MPSLDRHVVDELHPRQRLTDPEQSLVAMLYDAAGLLDRFGRESSEARKAAERLRALARTLAAAQRAETEQRRRQAAAAFDEGRR